MPKRTPSGKVTAVADVEAKLKRRYGANSSTVYKILNKIGLMRGSKTTAKGARAASHQPRASAHHPHARHAAMIKELSR